MNKTKYEQMLVHPDELGGHDGQEEEQEEPELPGRQATVQVLPRRRRHAQLSRLRRIRKAALILRLAVRFAVRWADGFFGVYGWWRRRRGGLWFDITEARLVEGVIKGKVIYSQHVRYWTRNGRPRHRAYSYQIEDHRPSTIDVGHVPAGERK